MNVTLRSHRRSRPNECHCGFDLRNAVAPPATEELLHAQVTLDGALDGGAVTAWGTRLVPHAFFEALQAITYLMRISGTDLNGSIWQAPTRAALLPPMSHLRREEACRLMDRLAEGLLQTPHQIEGAIGVLLERVGLVGLNNVRNILIRSGLPLEAFGSLGQLLTRRAEDL